MGIFDRKWFAVILGALCAMSVACESDELLKRHGSAGMNGSFEITDDGYPVNWVFFPNPEADNTLRVVLDSNEVVDGSHSLKLVVRTRDKLPAIRSREVAFEPGNTYRFSMSYWNEGCTLTVNRIVMDASGKTVRRRDPVIDTSVPSNGWEYFEETLSIAEDEAKMLLVIIINGSGTVRLDGANVERTGGYIPNSIL